VYVIRAGAYYKIGLVREQRNLRKRLWDIQISCPLPIEFIDAQPTNDAYRLEKALHKRYAEFRSHGEWFELRAEHLEELKKHGFADPTDENAATVERVEAARAEARRSRSLEKKLTGDPSDHVGGATVQHPPNATVQHPPNATVQHPPDATAQHSNDTNEGTPNPPSWADGQHGQWGPLGHGNKNEAEAKEKPEDTVDAHVPMTKFVSGAQGDPPAQAAHLPMTEGTSSGNAHVPMTEDASPGEDEAPQTTESGVITETGEEEDEPARVLRSYLADPPKWWARQARRCVEGGLEERMVKPLVSSTALDALGDVRKHALAEPFVREKLEEMAAKKKEEGK
jgi:hypothetical protein